MTLRENQNETETKPNENVLILVLVEVALHKPYYKINGIATLS